MIGGLIGANVAARPALLELLQRPATYAIFATDVGVGVSLRVADGAVAVRNGVIGRPEVLVEGESSTLVGLSSVPTRMGLPDPTRREGREMLAKLLRRRLRIKGLLTHPEKLIRLTKLLAV